MMDNKLFWCKNDQIHEIDYETVDGEMVVTECLCEICFEERVI